MELLNFFDANLFTYLESEGREALIQAWMRLNLSNDNLEDGIFNGLSSAVEAALFINCTVPDSATVDEIFCSDIF